MTSNSFRTLTPPLSTAVSKDYLPSYDLSDQLTAVIYCESVSLVGDGRYLGTQLRCSQR